MRCKVACTQKTPAKFGDNQEGFYLNFCPVYDGSPENKEFFKWTPGGTVNFNVLNLSAAEQFEVGKEYFVDFSPAIVAKQPE